MNYDFPVINTIDDVLPAIEGKDEFIVVEKDDYIVIEYVVNKTDTFDMDEYGPMRRECRGLIFNKEGKIISRPLQKFFNLNEREDTQIQNVDITKKHLIAEKMDGSMIRPIVSNGGVRLCTRLGITNVSCQAETWLVKQDDYKEKVAVLQSYIDDGITPIFEFVSENNMIVLKYDVEDLVLLALRDNITGKYIPLKHHRGRFSVVNDYGSLSDLDRFADDLRQEKEREGVVIWFADGHAIKIKTEEYVEIHRIVSLIDSPRHIMISTYNNVLDDALAKLNKERRDQVVDFQKRFENGIKKKIKELDNLFKKVDKYNGDRKRVALEFVPLLDKKCEASFVFSHLDGKKTQDILQNHIQKRLSSNTVFDELLDYLEVSK